MVIWFLESWGVGSVDLYVVKFSGFVFEEVFVDGYWNVDDGGEFWIVYGVDDGGFGDGVMYYVDGFMVRGVLIGLGFIWDMLV